MAGEGTRLMAIPPPPPTKPTFLFVFSHNFSPRQRQLAVASHSPLASCLFTYLKTTHRLPRQAARAATKRADARRRALRRAPDLGGPLRQRTIGAHAVMSAAAAVAAAAHETVAVRRRLLSQLPQPAPVAAQHALQQPRRPAAARVGGIALAAARVHGGDVRGELAVFGGRVGAGGGRQQLRVRVDARVEVLPACGGERIVVGAAALRRAALGGESSGHTQVVIVFV